MNVRAVLVLFGFLSVVSVGTALKCYVCAGTNTSECAKGKTSMVIRTCHNFAWQKLSHNNKSYEYDTGKNINVCLKLTLDGATLKCYVCAGTNTSDCSQGKKSALAIQTCQHPSDSITNEAWQKLLHNNQSDEDATRKHVSVCLKLTLNGFQPDLMVRGCGVVPARVDPCTFVKQLKWIEDCKACKTDLCNKDMIEEYNSVDDSIL